MKYYFSSPLDWKEQIKDSTHNKVLMSFAVDAKSWVVFKDYDVLIDSGAFSIINSGKKLTIEDYLKFAVNLPENFNFISFDVIPKDKKSRADTDKCAAASYENYTYLKQKLKKVLPVYHWGEDIKWFKKYLDETDYICVGSAPRMPLESIKHFSNLFNIIGYKPTHKLHGLAYTIEEGLYQFPFYSVDSVTYKKAKIGKKKKTYWAQGDLISLSYRNVREWMTIEQQITNYWKFRGVDWNE